MKDAKYRILKRANGTFYAQRRQVINDGTFHVDDWHGFKDLKGADSLERAELMLLKAIDPIKSQVVEHYDAAGNRLAKTDYQG